MSKPVVLVTGGTGLLGSHVISQLLEKGYTVRATVRPGRDAKLRGIFSSAGSQLETAVVASLTSNHSEAMKGADVVIHCAAPSIGVTGEDIFEGAYRGTVNVINAAIAAGIKKVVITGTIVSLFDSDFKAAVGTKMLTSTDFGSVTLDNIDFKAHPMTIYQQSKTLADKEAWEIAKKNPEVDITVIIPPCIFGSLVAGHPTPSSFEELSTVAFVYSLLTSGPDTYPDIKIGHMIDVRDAAKAHVLAISTPALTDGRFKRFIVLSKIFTWKEAAEVIKKQRPEVASRLPKDGAVEPFQTSAPLDTSFTAEVLGLKTYIPWEETLLASLDEVLRVEKIVKPKE